MKEQQIQNKVLKKLRSHGCYAINVITSSTAGTLDIVGCTRQGKFFSIEVKKPGGRASKLQLNTVSEIRQRNAVAFVVDDYKDFEYKFQLNYVFFTQ